MKYEIKVTTSKTSCWFSIGEWNTFEKAWLEFLNQIEESTKDEFIEIQMIDISDCTDDKYRYKGILLYRFVKDEIDGYQNHGTLYHIDVDGEQEDCLLDGSPDMQVASWTGTKEPKHFLTISDHYGDDNVDVETTEEIDSKYLVYHSFTGYYYKNKPLEKFVVSGKL